MKRAMLLGAAVAMWLAAPAGAAPLAPSTDSATSLKASHAILRARIDEVNRHLAQLHRAFAQATDDAGRALVREQITRVLQELAALDRTDQGVQERLEHLRRLPPPVKPGTGPRPGGKKR